MTGHSVREAHASASDAVVPRLKNLRLRLEGALANRREEGDREAIGWLAEGVAALNGAIGRLGADNVFRALWEDAEENVARLEAGFFPSRDQIAEAFHEHRRERETGLPPWSEVHPGSGMRKYAERFADRFLSLRSEPQNEARAVTQHPETSR